LGPDARWCLVSRGGFYIIEAEDLDAALAWASKAGAVMAPIEVRPFQDEPQA
jgi:hypothetical protein